MKWFYKTFRTLIVLTLALLVGVPALLYIVLSVPPVQSYIRTTAETELSKLLGVKVTIGKLDFDPFSVATLHNVTIADTTSLEHGPIATIQRLGSGINIAASLRNHAFVINYVELSGMNAHLWKATPKSPLNIAPIIKALSPKQKNKPPTPFSLTFNSVIIRTSSFAYDVYSEKKLDPNRFDPNHIAVSDLRADIRLPRIANDDFTVDVRSLKCVEHSGLELETAGVLHADNSRLKTSLLTLKLGESALNIAPIELEIQSLKSAGKDIRTALFDLRILKGSHVKLADLAPFVPQFDNSTAAFDIQSAIKGRLDSIAVNTLAINGSGLNISLQGALHNLTQGKKALSADLKQLSLKGNMATVATHLAQIVKLPPRVHDLLTTMNAVNLQLSGHYSAEAAGVKGNLLSRIGKIEWNANTTGDLSSGSFELTGDTQITDGNLTSFLPASAKLGVFSLKANTQTFFEHWQPVDIAADANIAKAVWNNYLWQNISAKVDFIDNQLQAEVISSDSEEPFSITASANVSRNFKSFSNILADVKADDFPLYKLPFQNKWSKYKVDVNTRVDINTTNIQQMQGNAEILGLRLNDGNETIDFGDIYADIDCLSSPMTASLQSEVADMKVSGSFNLSRIGYDVKDVLSRIAPALISSPTHKAPAAIPNAFNLDLNIKSTEKIEKIMPLPVSVIYPVDIAATLDDQASYMALSVDAPYLLQKDKLIENTSLNVSVDAAANRSGIYFTTVYPAKNGPVSLTFDGHGKTNEVSLNLSWDAEGEGAFRGDLSLSANAERNEDGKLIGHVAIEPTEFSINRTTWKVHPATIDIAGSHLSLSKWVINNSSQSLTMSGELSPEPEDEATVELSDINLDYIFDTLNIDNVDFGGNATGVVTVKQALSKTPIAWSDKLFVKNMSYNNCVFGDAEIASAWDNERQGITLDAEITRRKDSRSHVTGIIIPVKNGGGLDLTFDAERTPVSFLQPFMSAFCSRVDGETSGRVRLFGTFSDLDLEGDAYAHDLQMTIPFTNTTYTVSDSIHFKPGDIQIPDIVMRDSDGNKAMFRGWLRHRAFHDPVFEFTLHDARDFLAYNMPESDKQPWYGKVYVNGSTVIKGQPGVVDINVNVSTAPKSTFGFILSDSRSAGEYDFITFRDKTPPKPEPDPQLAGQKRIPDIVKAADQKAKETAQDAPTVFNMNINVDANPNVAVTLVMDPLAGDKIKSWGSGALRMTYTSRGDEMKMFGTYTLDRGTYNFTLQDIIVKEFILQPGSTITFHGNPFAAKLNMTAYYQTNANLADLDKSFETDADLKRTSVPVRALLNLTGDMRQPDLGFDLEFPTLTSDMDRKVRSIVNTEEMLDRQVIYLLALNRFYSGDFNMTGTERNNEIASLATNTLSSRISSLLGTISDKWNIAPSVRSENGDFKDTEFDLALSSHLLNDRLLLNGNIGYRDNSSMSTESNPNNPSFIGDFDLEYLLNPRGTLRLKAYNHFNDQSIFVKNALTTQGVGLVLKLDFDKLDSWLRPFKKNQFITPAPTDSIRVTGTNK